MQRAIITLGCLVLCATTAFAYKERHDYDPVDAMYGTQIAVGTLNARGVYPTNVRAAGVYQANTPIAGVYQANTPVAGVYNGTVGYASFGNYGSQGGYYDARRGGVYVGSGYNGSCSGNAYNRGFGQGYNQGYGQGYSNGYSRGYSDGNGGYSPYTGVNPWNGTVSPNTYNGYRYQAQPQRTHGRHHRGSSGVYGIRVGPAAPGK